MDATPFTCPYAETAQRQQMLDEIIPIIAGYFFTYLALQDRRLQTRGSSLRYQYVIYLIIFEVGCMAYTLTPSPGLSLPPAITAKILIGCGAAGYVVISCLLIAARLTQNNTAYRMFACVSAGKSFVSIYKMGCSLLS